MRMRRRNNLAPRMEACESVWIHEPEALRGSWRSLMPGCRELRVEVGCGKGKFTVETAEAEPDVLLIAIERVQDALVLAMEAAIRKGLKNVFFVSLDAANIDQFFADDEIDLLYINFCDPWPRKKNAKRRLTYHTFLEKYKKVLKLGGQIHFKTDNQGLFEFSVEEIPHFGFTLSEVTRNLHEHGPVGVMTDYEAKFYELGQPINRLVATQVAWEEPFPATIKDLRERWLDTFAADVSEEDLGKHVLVGGGYLWHIFSYNLVPCLEGDEARKALAELPDTECYRFYKEYPPQDQPRIKAIEMSEVSSLPDGLDWYLVDKDFTWTYVHTHEEDCGPYFCKV